jgi:GcrA cell cycle regulator
MMTSFWKDHPQAAPLMRELFARGLTMRQISAKVGCSRNAIIGRVHREGLARTTGFVARRKPQTAIATETKRTSSKRTSSMMISSTAFVPCEIEPPREIEATLAPTAGRDRKTIVQLITGDCRWPLGEPEVWGRFCFCAEPARLGSSYCRYHHLLGHMPTPPRRRRR